VGEEVGGSYLHHPQTWNETGATVVAVAAAVVVVVEVTAVGQVHV
jgi:hypothetical protein